MTDFPLHPTLFLSLAIMTGFMIAPLLAYSDKKSPIENSVSNANFLLSSTWFLAAAFSAGLFMVYISSPSNDAFEMAKALAPLGMMVAALIASASVMKNIAETKANEAKKHEREASKFHLDKCTEGLKHFYDLLKDGNNDRVTWLQASRILLITQELSEKITEPEHKDIYEIEESKTRFNLYSFFKNPINGHNLNERFFFGGDHWKKDLPSFQTLAEKIPSMQTIHEYSATAIFKFLDYPQHYSDPLDKLDVMSIDLEYGLWQSPPRVHLSNYIKGLEQLTKEYREKDQQ